MKHADCHQTTLTGEGTIEPLICDHSLNLVVKTGGLTTQGNPVNFHITQKRSYLRGGRILQAVANDRLYCNNDNRRVILRVHDILY